MYISRNAYLNYMFRDKKKPLINITRPPNAVGENKLRIYDRVVNNSPASIRNNFHRLPPRKTYV
jgi:hypothetical protein